MSDFYTWLTIGVIALVTAAIRFFPFLVFRKGSHTPHIIEKLGRLLPFAVMGMLVVYCLKETSFETFQGFLPELIACALVAGLYIWKRNTLLSIIVGTVSYMLLVQIVF